MTTHATEFPYQILPGLKTFPSDELYCIYRDQYGLLWMGTNDGLRLYDGYTVKNIKSNAFTPRILPNNNVLCITEDHNRHIWAGTRNGLIRLDRTTGQIKTYHLKGDMQRIIYTLFTSSDGTVWVGTDKGLSRYQPTNDTFYTYTDKNMQWRDVQGHRIHVKNYSPKSIIEDRNHNIYFGTWNNGLYRFRPESRTIYQYPPVNPHNSAYSLFFDSHQRLWIGTWRYGMVRMDHPENIAHPGIVHYPYLPNHFDTYYKFLEDKVSNTLWACSREGVSILQLDHEDQGWHNYTTIGNNSLNFSYGLVSDGQGNIWIGTMSYGIVAVNTHPSIFHIWNMDTTRAPFAINAVNSIYTADGTLFWMGLNPYGIALFNRTTGTALYNNAIPGLGNISQEVLSTKITSIIRHYDGSIWMANGSYGVIICPPGKPAYILNTQSAPYIKDNFVNTLMEDHHHIVWIGQRSALSLVYPSIGGGISLTLKDGYNSISSPDVRHIMEDRQGTIWVSTDNNGILRISGNFLCPSSLHCHAYRSARHNFPVDDATACFQDHAGNIWAISNSGGLFRYDQQQDVFVSVNHEYHIDGDRVFSINEDTNHRLWLTTDYGLVQLSFMQKDHPEVTTFSADKGLGDLFFPANSTFRYGNQLYFGEHTGFVSFTTPTAPIDNKRKTRLIITGLQLDDMPIETLDSALRQKITACTPQFTRNITIPSSVKKFSVDFALLTINNAEHNKYAFFLHGYDTQWHYHNSSSHKAVYQNLPDGNYELEVRATDSYGRQYQLGYTIHIRVLPPWYASWWAYALYIFIIAGLLYILQRAYRLHLQTRNKLGMATILTNITHELITPLTVISAAIDQMKVKVPQFSDDYQIILNNVNRLSRLFRQILEIQKSQAGQLRLQVTRSDLAVFIRKECDNIAPIAKKKTCNLKVNIPDEALMGWFDTDKVDKILYNLLSNAFKYSVDKGTVGVQLYADKGLATLVVEDNGIGIPPEKKKRLYNKFLDGDYRLINEQGTGLGLALTYELVKLHHGTIQCDSEEGKGTRFTVTLPIQKKDYTKDEMDFRMLAQSTDSKEIADKTIEVRPIPLVIPPQPKRKDNFTVLIVEDNTELLQLMQQMLSLNYHILTAHNGAQAWNILQKEKLDLVVSDIMMPKMNGVELLQNIRNNKDYALLPVILLSARTSQQDKNEGLAAGADDFISKPFRMEELDLRIRHLITTRYRIEEKLAEKQSEDINATTSRHLSDPSQLFLDKVRQQVMQHLEDSVYTREQLAEDLMISYSSLYKRLKELTGCTVTEYITHIKLEEAIRLLRQEPTIHINELAMRVGFNTPKYFTRCFKKAYGMLPKQYIDSMP